ncbi:MAG: patatin-like phospholipase family protein [Anaerolineales bacterium]
METIGKDTKVGLALGGGGVLGAAHIGVLKAVEELDIPIHYIAGTSIGALISALYAFGYNWQAIETITEDLNWLNASELSLSQFGILSNDKIGELITKNIGEATFVQADIPLAMIATDIYNGEKVILQEGSVSRAVMASTCVPGLFNPIEVNNKILVDGGIVENVPISPLQEMGAEYLIGVALGTGSAREKPENIIDVLLRSFYFSIEAATKLHTKKAHLLIQPDLASFNLISTQQTPALINVGYKEAKKEFQKRLAN